LSISKRLLSAVVGVAAVAVLGTVASTASAEYVNPNYVAANDPNTTNVPYLAWRGENLRLVQCFGADDFTMIRKQENPTLSANVADVTDDQVSNIFGSIVQTNVSMLDWSGYDTGSNQPHEVINGARTFLWFNFTTHHPVICFQDTWDSAKAGLASFKLTVSVGLTNIDNTGVSIGAQVLVLQHQWLAGWMSLNAPEINEVPSINQTGTNQNPEGLGDKSGDGTFFASNHWYQDANGVWKYDAQGVHPGEIRATVKGTLPLGQDFSELGIADVNGNITLPDDWAKLARAGEPTSDFATDGNYLNSNPAMRWDIHDEMVDQFGNTSTIPAATAGGRNGVGTTQKNVENVAAQLGTNNPLNNGNGDGWFTRNGVTTSQGVTVLPPSTGPTSGPFDPNFPGETLLPDGALNSGDAPMPAARIDFSIAANTDPLTSDDGVGNFDSAWKSHAYSKDYTGSNAVAGNLFAPFYSQYIPATSRDDIGYASGVDGALITSNFPGFLHFGLLTNWTAIPLGSTESTKTSCRIRGDRYGYTPGGTQTAAVYTDEHGEARISYYPGSDFYFDALNTTPGDSDNGCDLTKRELGTSNISVIARYPYQKVTDPDKAAKTTIKKTVLNLFDKHINYYPKNFNYNSSNALLAKIVVAHAQDIAGQPFAYEKVCFKAEVLSSGAESSLTVPAPGPVNINRPGNATPFSVQAFPATTENGFDGWLCTQTDANGNAVVETATSAPLDLNVLAYFVEEGLYRHVNIDLHSGGGTFNDVAPLTPEYVIAHPGATTGAGSNGTQAPSVDVIKAFGGLLGGAKVTPAATIAATPAATATITNTITPTTTITAKKVATKLLSLRLVRPAHGKAYFMVKVQSASKTVKVTLSLKNRHGKTITKITKTIAANKLVKIQSNLIKMSVKRVSLTLVK
jgi:hypothetical protein